MFDDSVYIQNISSYQLEWKIVFFCFESKLNYITIHGKLISAALLQLQLFTTDYCFFVCMFFVPVYHLNQ